MKRSPQKKKRVRSSRKTAVPSLQASWLEALDGVNDRFRKMTTLAELLCAPAASETMDCKLAAGVGHMIEEELEEAKALVSKVLRAEGLK